MWDRVRPPERLVPHLDAVVELAARSLVCCAGDTAAHLDLRDDNVVVDTEGAAWICDWNWAARSAAWVDLVTLLISARGDGHDADAWLSCHPLTTDVSPDHVDALLAALCGYMWHESAREPAEWSPFLRRHQRWYARVLTDWLADRRGWR